MQTCDKKEESSPLLAEDQNRTKQEPKDLMQDENSICSRHPLQITNMATPQLSLKLLIDTKANNVLFAEAGNDVVDFLFSFLSMPLGSIIRLLTKEKMPGCVGNLYKSVEDLDDTCIQSNQNKNLLLNPTTLASSSPSKNNLFLTEPAAGSSTTVAKKFYRCDYTMSSDNCTIYTDVSGTRCPKCNELMNVELLYVVPNVESVAAVVPSVAAVATAAGGGGGESGGGFVKGVGMVTYTVTDDLTVTPMSTVSCIALLNKLRVKEVGSLGECTVILGMNEALELLEASLQSMTALTDVFLGKKTAGQDEDDDDDEDDYLKTAAQDVNLK